MSNHNIEEQIRLITFSYMQDYGLIDDGWSIKINNSKKTLGCTYHDDRIIIISKYNWYIGELHDTILHEIAHALVGYDCKHGAKWKKMAKIVGCIPNSCI